MCHIVDSSLLHRPVEVHVIGCGGTGSAVVPGLAKIHRTMVALGHPGGLRITIWDDDEVALHNCVRQNFFEADVGRPKAAIMANRIAIAHSPAKITCAAKVERFTAERGRRHQPDFIVGCVDSKAARREISTMVASHHRAVYWVDCGNESSSGQVIVGQGGKDIWHASERLPLVTELFPEIASGAEDDQPSCSALQSILRQGVLTNAMAATWGLAWIDAALRHGRVDWCGVFFSLTLGRVTAIPADPAQWAAIGYVRHGSTLGESAGHACTT